MNVWTAPKVTVISRPQFIQADHLPVAWKGIALGAESLIEYSGRLCYMSQHNPGNKGTTQYIENILEMGHGSVLEHANFSLLLEGVSRSCSHEIVRHRAGCAYSQLSQRFVGGWPDIVMPPAVVALSELQQGAWRRGVDRVLHEYATQMDILQNTGLRGKQLKEAARGLLPNCVATKLVMSANARAWRHIIELRCSPGADAEIRRLFLAVLGVLKGEAPAVFGDFDGEGKPKWGKV